MRHILASCCAAAAFVVSGIGMPAQASAADGAAPIYQVTNVLKLGGEGRWDYAIADPASKLIYVSRQTHVQVVSEAGKIVADIKNTPGVHGIALAPEMNRGYISNGQGNSVTIFDLKNNQPLGTLPAGQNPDAIIYDPASKKVFAFNGRSNDVTIIDTAAESDKPKVPARLALDGKPEFAAADGEGHVFVALENKNSIAVIDSKNPKVTDVWKVKGGEEPSGLAIDAAHHRLFAGCGNNLMAILDSKTGKMLQTVPIGEGVDACAFDPQTGYAFASCGDGTLTIVKETTPGKFTVEQTVKTRPGARTMALDTVTHNVYLPTAEFGKPEAGGRRAPVRPGSFMLVVVSPVKH